MYEFMPGQATIVTEIYLPAQYAISPSFLQALDDSLLPKQVQQHFDHNTEETIKKLLPEKLRDRYSDLEHGIKRVGTVVWRILDLRSQRSMEKLLTRRSSATPMRAFELLTGPHRKCSRVEIGLSVSGSSEPSSLWVSAAMRFRMFRRFYRLKRVPSKRFARHWICGFDEGSFLLYGFVMYHLSQITKGREGEILLTSHFAVVNQIFSQGQSSLKTHCE